MVIEKIKIKFWEKRNKENSITGTGKKIILYTHEKQDFSIIEMDKITEFFKNLRS